MDTAATVFFATSVAAVLLALLLALVRRSYAKTYLPAAIAGTLLLSAAQGTEAVRLAGLVTSDGMAVLAAFLWLLGAAVNAFAIYELLMHRPFVRRQYRFMRAAMALFILALGIAAVARPELRGHIVAATHLAVAIVCALTALVTLRNRRGERHLSLTLLGSVLIALSVTHVAIALADELLVGYELRPLLAFGYVCGGLALLHAVFEDERESATLAASQIELLAYHDSLTGLPNRSLFFDRAVLALSQAERYGYEAAVLFFDLDRFKRINDSLGHHVGDQLLKATAERLQPIFRIGDTLARFGGDEFTVLLPRVSGTDDAVIVAQKILRAMREPFRIGERDLAVSTSIGIAIFPSDGDNPEVLIRNADTAMYRAKERGGDQYELYSPAMNEAALARLELDMRLRTAIQKGELELHYQPLINLRDHSVFGVEALLRWKNEEFGYIAPQRFIEAAEVSGLIVDIGEWALKEACRQVSRWQLDHHIGLSVSVNLSARQLRQPDLLLKVQRALAEAQLPPSSLELEITESNAMDDAEQTMSILRTLKTIGVRISIDDFGTGYSSLTYLQRFPIDTIKLDRSFVAHADRAEESAIVRGLISIAHGLGIKVIAEGVESEKQLAILKDNYCDVVQGYFFAEPLRAEDFSNFLRQHRMMISSSGDLSWQLQSQPDEQRRALVVDDDPAIRVLVQRILERARFTIDVARDGEEALASLRRKTYSAIFLDLMMPRVDGYEVLAVLSEEQPETVGRVVVMTAVAPSALERIAAHPVARVLPKPFDVGQIIASANEAALMKHAG